MANLTNVYGYAQGFTDSVTATGTTQLYQLGTERVWNGKKYVYCYNAEASAVIPIGYGVSFQGSTNPAYQVLIPTVAGDMILGVNATGATITAGHFFWALIKGAANIIVGTGDLTDTAVVTVASDGRFVDTATAGLVIVGVALASGTAGETKAVFFDIK